MHVESVDTVVVYFSFAFVIVIVYVYTCTLYKCGQGIYYYIPTSNSLFLKKPLIQGKSIQI